MRQAMTISLSKGLKKKLEQVVDEEGVSRSDVLRRAFEQYLVQKEFKKLHQDLVIEGRNRLLFSDEDIFKKVS